MEHKLWGHRSFCIVTGASQGIGAQIAVELAKKLGNNSLMLLLARSLEGLNKAKLKINEANPGIKVIISSLDLSHPQPEEFLKLIKDSLKTHDAEPNNFPVSIIVHNAGSLGDVTEYCDKMCDVKKIDEYFSLNLFSVMCLNSQFLSVFNEKCGSDRLVINITSLCAVKPMKSMGYYCIGKASREMYFKVLAEENSSITVLNYSPGPVNTDMISHIMDNVGDPEVKTMFHSLRDSQSILSVDQTVGRLLKILDKGSFKSGCRIDYFDKDE